MGNPVVRKTKEYRRNMIFKEKHMIFILLIKEIEKRCRMLLTKLVLSTSPTLKFTFGTKEKFEHVFLILMILSKYNFYSQF